MPNPDLHEASEVTDQQSAALAKGDLGAKQTIAINGLKDEVKKQLQSAGEYFSEEDQERWLGKLNSVDDTSTGEIQAIAQQIEKEKVVVAQMLTKYIGTVNQNRELFALDPNRKLDTAQAYIDEFRNQPYETKMEWLAKLASEIEGLKSLYEEAKSLAPDKLDTFKTMRRSEKKDFLSSLKNSRTGIRKIDDVLEKNRSHLSDEEMVKFKLRVRDLPASEQERMFGELMEKEIKPRAELTEKFRLFPAEYRADNPDFNKMSKPDREMTIQELVDRVGKEYRAKLFDDPLSKHICEEAKEAAYTWYVQAPLDKRIEALQMLDSQLRAEEKLSLEYEDLLEQMPEAETNEEVKSLRREFFNSRFEKKTEMIKELSVRVEKTEEDDEESETLDTEYEERLDEMLETKVISKDTRDSYLKWFKEQTLDSKKQAMELFDDEMEERIAITDRFMEELSEEIQEANKDFYTLGLHARLEKFEVLLKAQKNALKKDTNGGDSEAGEKAEGKIEEGKHIEDVIKELLLEAGQLEGEEEYEDALDAYDKILVLNPNHKFAQQRIEHLEHLLGYDEEDNETVQSSILEKAIHDAKNDNEIKEESTLYTITKVVSDIANASDQRNNKYVAEEKDAHLTEKEAEIQEKLVEDHEMMLDTSGEAVGISEIEPDAYEDLTASEKYELEHEVGTLQRDKEERTRSHHFQFIKEEKAISGKEGLEAANDQEGEIKEAILEHATENLEAGDIELDEKTAQKLEEIVKKDNVTVRLAA